MGTLSAKLGTFHFIFPENERVKPVEEEENTSTTASTDPNAPTMPGDEDMILGSIANFKDSSDTVSDGVRVTVTSEYRDERSNMNQNKLCFAYSVTITNESVGNTVQLVSRRFEIQTIRSKSKDVVQGPGVTGRQPMF